MLVEFRCANYRTFKKPMVFSMTPAPKQKDLEFSVFKELVGGKSLRGLCSAVIYGPNAAGKTNIIGAMDTFRAICLRGNIRNASKADSPNSASAELELIPNMSHKKAVPVTFGIIFTKNDMRFEYSLSADLGKFMDMEYDRRVVCEELKINDTVIFSRGERLRMSDEKAALEYLDKAAFTNLAVAMELAESNLKKDELFLMNGFKNIFAANIVDVITEWFRSDLKVVYQANSVSVRRAMLKPDVFVPDDRMTKALTIFGSAGNRIGYVFDDATNRTRLVSMVDSKTGTAITSEDFESYGTVRFANLYPLIAGALLHGCTLVIDEFDASIHPMALMSIIKIFHNDEINIHHAQLIFNTHNPIFLNANLYRRDEIRFVERSGGANTSELYSLADFGTAGADGVRKGEDYLKNYFVGRYGAIQEVDFTEIFKAMIEAQRKRDSKAKASPETGKVD